MLVAPIPPGRSLPARRLVVWHSPEAPPARVRAGGVGGLAAGVAAQAGRRHPLVPRAAQTRTPVVRAAQRKLAARHVLQHHLTVQGRRRAQQLAIVLLQHQSTRQVEPTRSGHARSLGPVAARPEVSVQLLRVAAVAGVARAAAREGGGRVAVAHQSTAAWHGAAVEQRVATDTAGGQPAVGQQPVLAVVAALVGGGHRQQEDDGQR